MNILQKGEAKVAQTLALAKVRLEPELEKALMAELQAIVAKPLSASMLRELEAMTRAVRGFLQAKANPEARLAGATFQPGMISPGDLIDGEPEGVFEEQAETFGATAIREIVSGLKPEKKREDVGYEAGQLIRSIQDAEEAKMSHIADALRLRLAGLLDAKDEGLSINAKAGGQNGGEILLTSTMYPEVQT